jgi:hypothetical protein
MVVARVEKQGSSRTKGDDLKLGRRLAALAGATGALAASDALAVPVWVPTAGVVSAQNIPGFSFSTTPSPGVITEGALRPPASAVSGQFDTGWDVDGNGQVDFDLENIQIGAGPRGAELIPRSPYSSNPSGLVYISIGTETDRLDNLAFSAPVNNGSPWWTTAQPMTSQFAGNLQQEFTTGSVGYFGFRFATGNGANGYRYGWGQLMIDGTTGSGTGYKIMSAFYQSTPDAAINVGQVPVAVPEPAGLALLGLGAAGVTAWRSRKRDSRG